ncbi:hypothetical protein BPAE_0173g00080 [Botrytis paeoniae]|uniref:BTB domain-containing protein n=1 Tax=Botrytis paeoniae TaxID=278948 RepID=A0A4Z1FG78_9HELO|nr:hypothetical protein BPAE_0173g00080 [Botrytis paeoniae]
MVGQSKRRKASKRDLGVVLLSDFPGENDIEGGVLITDLTRNAIQRTSAYHKAPDTLEQSSTATSTSTLAGSRARTPHSFLGKNGTQMLNIYVGVEKILFRVYKDLLCNKIEFFDRMFNGKFKEANENTAVLLEDDPEAFNILMCWVIYDKVRSLMGQDFPEEVQYIFEKSASKSPPRQYAARMLRFQSLKSPAEGRRCSIDSKGEPIPLSDVDVAALTKLLAKNEEILESYLEIAGRANNASGNEMDPRVSPFYSTCYNRPGRLLQFSSERMAILSTSYLYMARSKIASETNTQSPSNGAFSDIAGTQMVDLFVGPDKKLMRVHKGILCRKIPYFNKMFNGSRVESANNSATFPENTFERGTFKDFARKGSGGSGYVRGSFASTCGSGENALFDLSCAIIQRPVTTEKVKEAESPVKIKKTPIITFPDKTEMVDLIVGPEKTVFRVNKSLLCNKIPYFDKMFNGGFKEATDGLASFPEDFPEAFDILIQWIYSGRLQWFDIGTAGTSASWDFLNFYCLVEKICFTQLADFALDTCRKICLGRDHVFESPAYVQEVYNFTSNQSGLRRFFVQQLVWRYYTKEDSKDNPNDLFIHLMRSNDEIFTDFMFELRKYVVVAAIPKDPRVLDRNNLCGYHSHIRKEDCYLLK